MDNSQDYALNNSSHQPIDHHLLKIYHSQDQVHPPHPTTEPSHPTHDDHLMINSSPSHHIPVSHLQDHLSLVQPLHLAHVDYLVDTSPSIPLDNSYEHDPGANQGFETEKVFSFFSLFLISSRLTYVFSSILRQHPPLPRAATRSHTLRYAYTEMDLILSC